MELSILNLKGVINNLCNFALSKLPYRCHAINSVMEESPNTIVQHSG